MKITMTSGMNKRLADVPEKTVVRRAGLAGDYVVLGYADTRGVVPVMRVHDWSVYNWHRATIVHVIREADLIMHDRVRVPIEECFPDEIVEDDIYGELQVLPEWNTLLMGAIAVLAKPQGDESGPCRVLNLDPRTPVLRVGRIDRE